MEAVKNPSISDQTDRKARNPKSVKSRNKFLLLNSMNKKLQIEPIDLHELEATKGGWSYKGCIITNGKCNEGGCGIANGKCPEKKVEKEETLEKEDGAMEIIP